MSIDQHVVDMKFNNKQFESGVKETLNTLFNLKKGLDLSGSTKGLEDLGKAGNKISFDSLARNVETISSKFTALGIIGITALQNITNSAINAGKQLIKSLTIAPLQEGFQEYELKMDSIQTIMAGTGESLQTVSGYLDELNLYADRTIYSFADMTSNIGKFTNAGVSLDRSVAAIQGVSNAAALAGSNSNQASHAMYNFAQALSAGHVKLIDWKSIETANMATVQFKEELLETAVAAGTLTKTSDGMYQVLSKNGMGTTMKETISATRNFNDSLQFQWMNTEVLIDTLGRYADETTEVGKRAFAAATEIKTFTQLLDTMKEAVGSGWAQTWEIIIGDFDQAKITLTEIGQAFDAMVGASTDARNEMLEQWSELGGRKALIDGLRHAIEAVAKVIQPFKDAFRDIFPQKTATNLLLTTIGFRDFAEGLKISEATSDKLKRTFSGLFAVVDIGKEAFTALLKSFSTAVSYILPMTDGILDITASFGDYLVALRDTVKETKVFSKIFEGLGSLVTGIAKAISTGFEHIVAGFKSFNSKDADDIAAAGEKVEKSFKPFTAIANVVKGAFDIISNVTKKMAPLFLGLATGIGKGLGAASSAISDWFSSLNFGQGLNVFNSGMFAVILLGIKKFTGSLTDFVDNGSGILGGIRDIVGGVGGIFQDFQSQLKANVLMKIAGAIALLAASLVVLTMVDGDKLGVALVAISVLFAELFTSMAIFEKVMAGSGFKGITKITIAMIALSTATLILASAVKKLADLEWDGLLKGLTGVGVLIGMLVLAAKSMSDVSGKLMSGSLGFIAFAIAINVLTKAVEKLGEMDTGELIQGLAGVGALLLGLGVFMKTVDLDGMGILKGVGILALAAALVVMSTAVRKLSELDTNAMIQGLIGLGVVLAEIGIFLKLTGDSTKVLSTAVGLTVLAAAMLIFANVVNQFGSMETGTLIQGLIGLAGALTIITVALQFLQGSLGGAAALLVVAGALAILAPVLERLGGMTLTEIGMSLLTLAGTFTVLGVAGVLLAPIVPGILALGVAILALGAGVTLIGGGLALLAAGFSALAVAGAAGVSVLVLAVTGLIGLIPMFLQQVALGLIAFAKVIGDGAPAIIGAIANVIVAVAEAIIVTAPKVAEAVVVLLYSVLDAVEAISPKLGESLINIVVGLLEGMLNAVKTLLGIQSPSSVFKDIAGNIIDGFILGIKEGINKVIEWGTNIGRNLLDAVKKFLGIKSPSTALKDIGTNVIAGFVDGIKSKISDVTTWAGNIGKKALEGVKNLASDFTGIGKDVVGGLVEGLKGKISDVGTWGKNLGKSALDGAKNFLQINSPSQVFMNDVGSNIGAGLINGIKKMIPDVTKESEKLGESTTDGTAAGITKGTPKVKKAAKKAAKTVFEETKEWIDKQRKYHDLSLEQELSKWKGIQNKYKDGSDERLEIDRRMFEIKKQMDKDAFDHSVNWINQEKFYNRLSLAEELAAWERVQARYEKGSEERIRADREVYTLKNELVARQKQLDDDYYENTKTINEKLKTDIQGLNDEYDKAVEARTKSLASAFGLFEEVTRAEERVDGKDLLNNLDSQVNAFDSWQKNITRLVKKGIDEGLIQELREMGPKSLEQIEALNGLSGRELDKYVELWKTKHEQAKTQAVLELEGLREETNKKIEALEQQAETDLEEYKTIWLTKTEELSAGVQLGMETMKTEVVGTVQKLKTETIAETAVMVSGIKDTVNNENWASLGYNIVAGIARGIEENAYLVMDSMEGLARAAVRAAEDELAIKSPSKVFTRIGKQTVQGFALGVSNFSKLAVDEVKNMGSEVVGTMSKTISRISDALDSNMDLQPTIRPVLDLTDIQSGGRDIARLLDGNVGFNIPTGAKRASQIASYNSSNTDGLPAQGIAPVETNVSFVQNNYSPKPLSRIDIYRQTKNQISSMKGVLNNI